MDFTVGILILLMLFGTLFGKLFASNLYDSALLLSRWIVKYASRLLHIEERARYYTIWLHDLDQIPGKLNQFVYALRCIWAAVGLRNRPRPSASKLIRRVSDHLHYQTIPPILTKLSTRTTEDAITLLYTHNFNNILQRDAAALAGTRILCYNLRAFARMGVDGLLPISTARLLSSQEGGRSFVFGGVSYPLRSSLNLPFDPSFIGILAESAVHGIEMKTLLNPEFGLVILANLVERFPWRDDLYELLQALTTEIINSPQNPHVEDVARHIKGWMPKRKNVPVEVLFPHDWLDEQVIRPLRKDSEIFFKRAEAELAVERLNQTIKGASPREIYLYDQMIRLEASALLQKLC